MTDRIVPIAPSKIAQIREAGRQQLSAGDYEALESLLLQLQIYGMTPLINVELGKLISKIQWGLEISESPQWAEALIACDAAFLGAELKEMCDEMGISSYGHKKELCRRLYNRKQPAVVEIMEPYLRGERV